MPLGGRPTELAFAADGKTLYVANYLADAVQVVDADSGTVTVQVLTFESGAHIAAGEGAVEILQFAGAPGQGLVHVGGIAGGTCGETSGNQARGRCCHTASCFRRSNAKEAVNFRRWMELTP